MRWEVERFSESVDPSRLKGTSFPAPQDGRRCHAMRATHQQFTTALDGLTRQNSELQNELAQRRQQAANDLSSLGQEVRGSPLRWSQATGVGVDPFAGVVRRLLRGARLVARLEHSAQGVSWRSDTTSASKCQRRSRKPRSWTHDLQWCSSENTICAEMIAEMRVAESNCVSNDDEP